MLRVSVAGRTFGVWFEYSTHSKLVGRKAEEKTERITTAVVAEVLGSKPPLKAGDRPEPLLGVIVQQSSKCSWRDVYRKSAGRKLALRRAITHWGWRQQERKEFWEGLFKAGLSR